MHLSSHIEPSLLARLVDGEATRAAAAKSLLHLQCCPACHAAFRQKHPAQSEALWERMLGDLNHSNAVASPALGSQITRVEAEARAANAAFGKLRVAQPEKRCLLVANSPALASLAGVQCLLEEARDHWQSSPLEAVHWSELALRVLDSIPCEQYSVPLLADYTARTWAYLGNAMRLCSDLAGAEVRLKRASFWLTLGTQEPLEKAMLNRLEAVLARDQRRFSKALQKGFAALSSYREIGDDVQAAWMKVALAITYLYDEDYEAAAASLEVFLRQYTLTEVGSKIYVAALHNAAIAMLECDRIDDAASQLQEARRLAGREADLLVEARFDWLEARILARTNQPLEAEGLFRQVQATFALQGAPFDAALVSVDLAAFLLSRGAMTEVKALAEDMIGIFLERDIHREARAAGILLSRALLEEQASVTLVRAVARYLKLARRDPTHRFTLAE